MAARSAELSVPFAACTASSSARWSTAVRFVSAASTAPRSERASEALRSYCCVRSSEVRAAMMRLAA